MGVKKCGHHWKWVSDNVTLDFLVDDTGKTTEIKDKAMRKRIMEIQALDAEEQKTIVLVPDSLLRDQSKKGVCVTITHPCGRWTSLSVPGYWGRL